MNGKSPPREVKKGIFGHFLSTKKADFNEESTKVEPTFVKKEQEGAPKMIDLAAYRKGLDFHGTDQKKLVDEN